MMRFSSRYGFKSLKILAKSVFIGLIVLGIVCIGFAEKNAQADSTVTMEGFSQQKIISSPDRYLVQWKVRNNGVLRALVDAPANPSVGLVLFAGDNGCLGITAQGEQTALTGNFLARTRSMFTAEGMLTLLLDAPSDFASESSGSYRTSEAQALDAELAVEYIRKQWKIPVILAGTSRGTISAANIAARKSHMADGLVLTSSVTQTGKKVRGTIYDAKLSAITIPTLIVHNTFDGCKVSPYSGISGLQKSLKQASRIDVVTVSQGDTSSEPCQGMSAHGFLGAESQTVSAVCDWVRKAILRK